MSHEPPDPFADNLHAQLEAALARAEAAEQKVKELEARAESCCGQCDEANERARIREGLEKLQRLGPSAWDGTPLPQSDGEWLRRADALALVEEPR